MESLFYAIGVILSGSFVIHFTSQFSYSIWLIYFIVGQMRPYVALNEPWTPTRARVQVVADETGEDPALAGSLAVYMAWSPAWKANPTAMTIIACVYMVIDLVLIVWCAYIFALVVRLSRQERAGAVRIILSMICNRLATPAFASVIMMAAYLCWGFWVWFSLCAPDTPMRSLNLANALMLTVPNALFTVLWVIGNGCEITDHVRGGPARRQAGFRPVPVMEQDGRPAAPAPGRAAVGGGLFGVGGVGAGGGGGGGGAAGGAARVLFADIRDALRRDIQIVLNQLARIMATLLAIRR